MFWNKTNSKRIDDLATEMTHIRLQLEALKLDLELYVKKLKLSKGLKSIHDDLPDGEKKKDPYDGMFLPNDGKGKI